MDGAVFIRIWLTALPYFSKAMSQSSQSKSCSQGLALEKGTQTEVQTKDKETQTQTKEEKKTEEFQQSEDDYLFECYLKEEEAKQTKAKPEEPNEEKSESSSLLYSDPETSDFFDKSSWAWTRDFEEGPGSSTGGPGPSALPPVDPHTHEVLDTRPYHHLMLDPRNKVFRF